MKQAWGTRAYDLIGEIQDEEVFRTEHQWEAHSKKLEELRDMIKVLPENVRMIMVDVP